MSRLPLHTIEAANSELRQPAVERDLATRVAALERMNSVGRILDVQTKNGAAEAYSGVMSNSGASPLVDRSGAGALPMQLTYTPQVNCWWEVNGGIGLVLAVDATNYHYIYGAITISPADADGLVGAYALAMQHNAVDSYIPRNMTRIFKLTAGTTYAVSLALFGGDSGGQWQYYCGPNQLWINAKAMTR